MFAFKTCEIGECIPYYLCLNGSIITDGDGLLDVRLGADDDPEPEKHPCPDFFETCCSLKSNEPIFNIPNAPDTKTEFIKADKCGIRNKLGNGFTVKPRENEAQFGKFWFFSSFFSARIEL